MTGNTNEGKWLEQLKIAERTGGVFMNEATLFELIDYIRQLRKLAGFSK